MPKYRILSDDELKQFDEEFKQFLIVNGIYADEWLEINTNKPEKALVLVKLFSDFILEGVYQKIHYLEKRSKSTCFIFNCLEDEIHLIVLQAKQNQNIDLSTPESIHEAMKTQFDKLTFFKSKKHYSTSRAEEIHQLIEQGAAPSSKEFWDMLVKITQ